MAKELDSLQSWVAEVSSFALPNYKELPNVDLYMEQVLSYVNTTLSVFSDDPKKILTSFMVNNYVKGELIKEPVKKKYDKEQIGYLLAITLMKQTLSMGDMALLLDLDRYVTDDKRRLYDFYRTQESTALRNHTTLMKRHIDDIEKRYEKEKKTNKDKAKANLEAGLGLIAFRMATQAQVLKTLSDRLIEEVRQLRGGEALTAVAKPEERENKRNHRSEKDEAKRLASKKAAENKKKKKEK